MSLTARVQNGRLTLNEPTDLPEGSEVRLEVVRAGEWEDAETLSPIARQRIEAALVGVRATASGGKQVEARELLEKLLKRP